MAHARPLSSPLTVTQTLHSFNAIDPYLVLLYILCVSPADSSRCAACLCLIYCTVLYFVDMSCTLTLLAWMRPTTVCGSDIAYSCVWMLYVVHLTTVYRCRDLLYPTHTVSWCYVISPLGCTAAEFVCVCLVASPTRVVEVTCSVMAMSAVCTCLAVTFIAGVFATYDSSFRLCLCRRAVTLSVLLDHQHPHGAAALPQHYELSSPLRIILLSIV